MPSPVTVLTFAPDESQPSRELIPGEAISEKWFGVCAELLNTHGPVFRRNLGSTLSHMDIHMGGPIGRLLVNGTVVFEFAISRGTGDKQDVATVQHFAGFCREAFKAAGTEGLDAAFVAPPAVTDTPVLLLFDYFADIDERNALAIAQLGIHLASAYVEYCNSGLSADSTDGPSEHTEH